MKAKAAFFDIDGTLMIHGIVPKDTRKALARLREQGIFVFVATGRHILEMEMLPVNDLVFDGYVLLNGQVCLDKNREVVYEAPIPPEDIQRILPDFEKKELPLMFVEKDRIYMNYIDEKVRIAQKAISTELPEVADYHGDKVYQVDVFSGKVQINDVMARMSHCKMTRWNPYAVDIIPKNGGKTRGINAALRYWGLTWEEVIAFGDGENDMEMLEAAGTGVAMGNSEECVKQCADYVTGDADKGGIWDALKQLKIMK